jgi:hypothetical protein
MPDSPESAEGLSVLSAGTRGPAPPRWFQGFLNDLGLRKNRRRLCGGVGQPANEGMWDLATALPTLFCIQHTIAEWSDMKLIS